MRTVQADLGHTITSVGDGYAISYRHKKPGIWLGLFYTVTLTVILAFPIAGLINHTIRPVVDFTNGTLVLTALGLAALIGITVVLYRNSRKPVSGAIAVSPRYLDANGKRYERQHIRDLYAKAPSREEIREPIIQNRGDNRAFIALGASGALGGGGILAAGAVTATQTAEDAGRVIGYGVIGGVNAWHRTRGWSLLIDYGANKPVRIAHRIDERDIQPLLNDLLRLLRA